jgi:hypothetical protein
MDHIRESLFSWAFVMVSFRNQIPSQIILLADTMFPPKVLAIFLWIWVGNVINIHNFGYVHVAEYSGETASTFVQQRHMEVVRCSHQRGVKSFPTAGSNGIQQKSFFFFSSMNPWKSHFYPIIYRGLTTKSFFFQHEGHGHRDDPWWLHDQPKSLGSNGRIPWIQPRVFLTARPTCFLIRYIHFRTC